MCKQQCCFNEINKNVYKKFWKLFSLFKKNKYVISLNVVFTSASSKNIVSHGPGCFFFFIINRSHLTRPRNLNECDFSTPREACKPSHFLFLIDRSAIPMADREREREPLNI